MAEHQKRQDEVTGRRLNPEVRNEFPVRDERFLSQLTKTSEVVGGTGIEPVTSAL